MTNQLKMKTASRWAHLTLQCKGENENFEDLTRLRDYVGMRDSMIELKMKTRSSWPDVSVVAPRVPLCESSS